MSEIPHKFPFFMYTSYSSECVLVVSLLQTNSYSAFVGYACSNPTPKYYCTDDKFVTILNAATWCYVL